jgi:hypothetical protein
VVGGNTYTFTDNVYYQGGPSGGGGRDLQSVTFDDDGTPPSFVTDVTGGTTTRTAGSNAQSTPVESSITVEAPCVAGVFGANDTAKQAASAVQYVATAVGGTGAISTADVDASTAWVNITGTVTSLGSNCATNGAPTVAAGGPYNGAEGSDISIDGASAAEPDSDPLTYSWAKDESGIVDGGSCTLTNPTTLTPTLNCDDNGSVTLTLTVDDGNGHMPSAQAIVDVSNADPSATPGIPGFDVNEGDSFELSLSSLTDPGSNDTHTYQFDCGDGGGYNAASTTASRSCPTTDNGSRSVSLKILDDDGGFAEYPGTVTVVNVDPTVAAPSFQAASIGCRTSVTLSRIGFNDPGADADWTVEIDWDDGSTTSYDTASKGVQPVQTHQYDSPGTYTATVTVTDKDGGVGSNTSSNSLAVDQTYTVDFLPPFDDSAPSGLIVNRMKNGRVVPVKATVYDDCALSFVTDPDADVTIRTSKTSGTGAGDPVEEYADAGESSGGTDAFRWSDDGFWIYNLDSKALGLVVNNLYRVDIYVGGIQATISNWAVLQPVK